MKYTYEIPQYALKNILIFSHDIFNLIQKTKTKKIDIEKYINLGYLASLNESLKEVEHSYIEQSIEECEELENRCNVESIYHDFLENKRKLLNLEFNKGIIK